MKVYQIQDKINPDDECVIYTSLESAIRDIEDRLKNLDVGFMARLTIMALEMTQEEFDELPVIER